MDLSKNLKLVIEKVDEIKFKVKADSNIGTEIEYFEFDFNENDLIDLLVKNKFSDETQKIVGKKLFNLIFKNSILQMYEELKNSSKIVKTLLLELHFEREAVQVSRLPWELIYDGNRFLVSSGIINLVRYVASNEKQLSETSLPLRVLIIVSRPLKSGELDDLIEREALIRGLNPLQKEGKVIINFLNPPTHDSLIKALSKNDYDIIHFDGHGTFHEEKGYLLFENEILEGDLIDSDTISNTFSSTDTKLIVLTACQSSSIGRKNIFNSVAPSLIRANTPAVIAMQFSIPLNSAVKFVEHFYMALSNYKSLSDSVLQGRKAIYKYNTWFMPTLYVSNNIDKIIVSKRDLDEKSKYAPKKRLNYEEYYEPFFIGRSDELIRLSNLISSTRTNVVVIWGPGGIGKTSLVKKYILRQNWRFDNGKIIWVDLRGGKSLHQILEEISLNLQIHLDNLDISLEIRRILENNSFLIVFDNFEDVENDIEITDFIKLIPRPSRIILTTRYNSAILDWKKIQLYKLTLNESIKLFCLLCEGMGIKKSELKINLIKNICKIIDGHPLGLILVVRMLESNSLVMILNKIKINPLKGIKMALDISYNDLNESAQNMIQRLSVFDSVFNEEAIEYVSGIENYEEIKEELVRRSFIHFEGEMFILHFVIKQYSYDKLENKKKYHILAADYFKPINPFLSFDQLYYAKEWYSAALLTRDILSPISLNNIPTLDDPMKRINKFISTAEMSGDNTLRLLIEGDVGYLYQKVGLTEKAMEHYKKSYDLITENEGLEYKCNALADIAQLYSLMGSDEKALELLKEIEKLIEIIDNFDIILFSTVTCANIYRSLGIRLKNKDYVQKSILTYNNALEIAGNYEDQRYIAGIYNKLGDAHQFLEDNKNALKYFKKSLDIRIGIEDIIGCFKSNFSLGQLYMQIEKYHDARECFAQMILLSNQVYFANVLEFAFFNLGKINLILSDDDTVPNLFGIAIIMCIKSKDNNTQLIVSRIEEEIDNLFVKNELERAYYIIGGLFNFFTSQDYINIVNQLYLNSNQLSELNDVKKQIIEMTQNKFQNMGFI